MPTYQTVEVQSVTIKYLLLQDFLIPIRHLGKAIQLSDEVLGVYPAVYDILRITSGY